MLIDVVYVVADAMHEAIYRCAEFSESSIFDTNALTWGSCLKSNYTTPKEELRHYKSFLVARLGRQAKLPQFDELGGWDFC